jgi:hypothetical protein
LHSTDSKSAKNSNNIMLEMPMIMWSAENVLNPYQPGIESQLQWQELSLEIEPASQLISPNNPFHDDSDVDPIDLPTNNPPQETQPDTLFDFGGQGKEVDGQEEAFRKRRKDWELRWAQENTKLGEIKGSVSNTTHQSRSLYFTQHRFSPIFTARERKSIFEVVLPEIFLDDVSRSIERESERLSDIESRLRRSETLQYQQLQMLQNIFEILPKQTTKHT